MAKRSKKYGVSVLSAVVAVMVIAFTAASALAQDPPISHWKLDEVIGTTAYDSEGNNDGTLVNGPVWTTGLVDGALSFDGSNDYVDVSGIGDDIDRYENSVELWVNPSVRFDETTPTQMFYAQYHRHYIGYGDDVWKGYITARVSTTQISYYFFYEMNLEADTWYHLVLTFESPGKVAFYVNGAQVGEQTDTTGLGMDFSSTWGYGFSLGRMYDYLSSRSYLNGTLDEVRIYNRVLTPEEIQQHYQDGFPATVCKAFLTPKKLNLNRRSEHSFKIHIYPCEPMDVFVGDLAEVYVDVDGSEVFEEDELYLAIVSSTDVDGEALDIAIKVHCDDLVDNDPGVAIYSIYDTDIVYAEELGGGLIEDLALDTFLPPGKGHGKAEGKADAPGQNKEKGKAGAPGQNK